MEAHAIFVDVSRVSLGLCPKATEEYLTDNALINAQGECVHKKTGKEFVRYCQCIP